jgi:hypothetical protein
MLRRLFAASFAIVLGFAVWCGPALAQTSPSGSALVTRSFVLSSAGPAPVLALTGGQSYCAVVLESATAFSGATVVPQASSDGPNNPQTWTNTTSINSGSISTTGTFQGPIAQFGITNFRVNVTALSSGTITGVISCSTLGGAGQTVLIGNTPVNVFTPLSANNGAQPGQSTLAYMQAYNTATGNFDPPRVDPAHVLEMTDGGTQAFVLTSASATACTSLGTGAGRFLKLFNTGPVTTVFVTFYNEGASPTCAASDRIYGDGTSIVVPAGGTAPLTYNMPVTLGLAYKLSAALSSTQNVIVTTFGLGI